MKSWKFYGVDGKWRTKWRICVGRGLNKIHCFDNNLCVINTIFPRSQLDHCWWPNYYLTIRYERWLFMRHGCQSGYESSHRRCFALQAINGAWTYFLTCWTGRYTSHKLCYTVIWYNNNPLKRKLRYSIQQVDCFRENPFMNRHQNGFIRFICASLQFMIRLLFNEDFHHLFLFAISSCVEWLLNWDCGSDCCSVNLAYRWISIIFITHGVIWHFVLVNRCKVRTWNHLKFIMDRNHLRTHRWNPSSCVRAHRARQSLLVDVDDVTQYVILIDWKW